MKFREAVNLKYLNRNELNKACFAHDVVNSNGTDLAERTISDEILKDRAYEIARSGNYDEYWRALPSMVCRFCDKKIGSGISVNE